MSLYADLELQLDVVDAAAGIYSIETRFEPAGEDGVQTGTAPFRFTLDLQSPELSAGPAGDPARYGAFLSRAFFSARETTGDTVFSTAFEGFRARTDAADAALRVRIAIAAEAGVLHTLAWETLCDPRTGGESSAEPAPLFDGDRLVLSRFLAVSSTRRLALRPRAQLRALVVVANPRRTIEKYQLAPIPADAGTTAEAAMQGVSVTVLPGDGAVSLERLKRALRDGGGYDILYLVCHGWLKDGKAKLLLDEPEREDGPVTPTDGQDLVGALADVGSSRRLGRHAPASPSLVVLASCQSAGPSDASPGAPPQSRSGLAGLGPTLATAGIGAVVAMQGQVTMDTANAFMTTFFTELTRDGQIDRAMAAGRSAVGAYPDWWMPVLFMRLKEGRIWTEAAPAAPWFVRWRVALVGLLLVAALAGFMVVRKSRSDAARLASESEVAVAAVPLQSVRFKGTVADEAGRPVQGATLLVDGVYFRSPVESDSEGAIDTTEDTQLETVKVEIVKNGHVLFSRNLPVNQGLVDFGTAHLAPEPK